MIWLRKAFDSAKYHNYLFLFFSSAIHRINATGGVFEEYLTLDVEPAGLANFCP